MEVELTYSAPVFVTVDIDTGEVLSVTVGDEMLTIDEDKLTPDQRSAYEIAEKEMWPVWEHGF